MLISLVFHDVSRFQIERGQRLRHGSFRSNRLLQMVAHQPFVGLEADTSAKEKRLRAHQKNARALSGLALIGTVMTQTPSRGDGCPHAHHQKTREYVQFQDV